MRTPNHPKLREPKCRQRKIRSMYGEPWQTRKTVGTNVSQKEHELLLAIAAAHGVSLSTFLRAVITDVLAEEVPNIVSEIPAPENLYALKVAAG